MVGDVYYCWVKSVRYPSIDLEDARDTEIHS